MLVCPHPSRGVRSRKGMLQNRQSTALGANQFMAVPTFHNDSGEEVQGLGRQKGERTLAIYPRCAPKRNRYPPRRCRPCRLGSGIPRRSRPAPGWCPAPAGYRSQVSHKIASRKPRGRSSLHGTHAQDIRHRGTLTVAAAGIDRLARGRCSVEVRSGLTADRVKARTRADENVVRRSAPQRDTDR